MHRAGCALSFLPRPKRRASGCKTLAKTATRRPHPVRLQRRRGPAAGTVHAGFTRSSRGFASLGLRRIRATRRGLAGRLPVLRSFRTISERSPRPGPSGTLPPSLWEGKSSNSSHSQQSFRSPTRGQQRSTARRGDSSAAINHKSEAKPPCPSSSTPTRQEEAHQLLHQEAARASSSRSATRRRPRDSPSRRREEEVTLLEMRNRERKF